MLWLALSQLLLLSALALEDGDRPSLSGEIQLLRDSFLAGDEDQLLLHIEHLDRLAAAQDVHADGDGGAGGVQRKGEDAIRAASDTVDDMEHQGEEVRQQVALLFDEIELEHRDADSVDALPHGGRPSKRGKSKTHHSKEASRPKGWNDKKEVARLRQVITQMKRHQAAEMEKLVAVKQGVEALVKSLNGTKTNLASAKHESVEMEAELQNLHKQAAAASRLDAEIHNLQEHARVNYETGEVEVRQAGKLSRLTVDEVAAKVKGKGGDPSNSANLADPAVLHADLRLLLDIVLLLSAATIGGMAAAVVRMPPIVGYIAGGVLVGPSGWSLVKTVVQVETLAQFGSIFFLFEHGVGYSFKEQREFNQVAVGGCLLSMAIVTVYVQLYLVWAEVAKSPLEGGLLGLSASLCSLSVLIDLLHEDRQSLTQHGKLMLGFMAFQGLLMGLSFSIPPALSGGSVSVGGVGIAVGRALLGVVVVVAIATFVARSAMQTLLRFLLRKAKSKDLFLLGVVWIAMSMALFTEFLGLSLDLGAFFAGLMIAGSSFTERTIAAIQPLASVFAAMLFASIGMIINPVFFFNNFWAIFRFVAHVLVAKIVVVSCVVRLFNYPWRIAIVSGIGLGHVGEFALLFASKLQTHQLLSRRAYLLFLAMTVTTLVISPVLLRALVALAERLVPPGGVSAAGIALLPRQKGRTDS